MADLAAAVLEFCDLLRSEHDFRIGRAEMHDALRGAEIVGVHARARLKAALRAVCCSRPEEIAPFDRTFDAFFTSGATGVPQSRHARRDRRDGAQPPPRERPSSFHLENETLAERWQALRARYSPIEGASSPPPISSETHAWADALAKRLIARVRLGRSRRLRPHARGVQLDLRRTVRASLRTGGEIVMLRKLGRPRRNPRFLLLIDASRSMSDHAPAALALARALCRRTLRAGAFVFSTQLREITRDLRRLLPAQPLGPIGEAWGGGTRIGASLHAFVRRFGARLDEATFVIVVSDGLDVGEVERLEQAMREIARRSAAIAWVNPHAAEPGFTPTARGMLAVLPYIDTLGTWSELVDA